MLSTARQAPARIGSNQRDIAMRSSPLPPLAVLAIALTLAGALLPASRTAQAQPSAQLPPPYKPVAITLPPPMNDPSFDDFRKQIAQIVQKRDRAALAPLVAPNFFWVPEDGDIADKSKPAIDNLAKAIGLDGSDGYGWDALGAYAAESSATPDPQRAGVFCAPAEPGFDDKAADELANVTQTDASDWVFPIRDGVEVRAAAKEAAPVIDKLGLYLVRVLPDDSPANAIIAMFVKVLTPTGSVGFVPIDAVLPVAGDQLCYLKDAGGWKIAGFLGGEPNQ
jgi:hypothetical protein